MVCIISLRGATENLKQIKSTSAYLTLKSKAIQTLEIKKRSNNIIKKELNLDAGFKYTIKFKNGRHRYKR